MHLADRFYSAEDKIVTKAGTLGVLGI